MSLSARLSRKNKKKIIRNPIRPKTASSVSQRQKSSIKTQLEGMERHLKSLHPKKRKFSIDQFEDAFSKLSSLPSLRRENALLKKHLSELIHNTKSKGEGDTTEQRRVHQLRLLFDQLRATRNSLEKENERKVNVLRDLRLESKPIFVMRPILKKKIEKLETELDRILIKFNECVEISSSHKSVLSSLRTEERQFDHRLSEIEKSLVEKSYDCKELEKMCIKAKNMKEQARYQLENMLGEVEGMVGKKEKEIFRKMRFVGEKISLTKKITEREERRRNMEFFGKEENDSESLILRVVVNRMNDRRGERKIMNKKRALELLERRWMDLKELTGYVGNNTSDFDESIIMSKLSHTYDVQVRLSKSVEEAKKKYERLLSHEHNLRSRLRDTEFGGIHIGGRRTTLRLIERSQNYFEVQKSNLEELKSTWIEINQVLSNLSIFLKHLNEVCKEFLIKNIEQRDHHQVDGDSTITSDDEDGRGRPRDGQVIPQQQQQPFISVPSVSSYVDFIPTTNNNNKHIADPLLLSIEEEEEEEEDMEEGIEKSEEEETKIEKQEEEEEEEEEGEGEKEEEEGEHWKKWKFEDQRIKDIINSFHEFEQYSFEICRRYQKIKKSAELANILVKNDKKFSGPPTIFTRRRKYNQLQPPSIELREIQENISEVDNLSLSPQNIRVNVFSFESGDHDREGGRGGGEEEEKRKDGSSAASSTGGLLLEEKKGKEKMEVAVDVVDNKTLEGSGEVTTMTNDDENDDDDKVYSSRYNDPVAEVFDRKQIKFMSSLAVVRGRKRASFQFSSSKKGKKDGRTGLTGKSGLLGRTVWQGRSGSVESGGGRMKRTESVNSYRSRLSRMKNNSSSRSTTRPNSSKRGGTRKRPKSACSTTRSKKSGISLGSTGEGDFVYFDDDDEED